MTHTDTTSVAAWSYGQNRHLSESPSQPGFFGKVRRSGA
jgi:hypothetical protein